MRCRFFSILVFSLLLAPKLWSKTTEAEQLFMNGNHAYAAERYLEAKENYEKLLKEFQFDNYAVNYNLGCCYYQLHQLGYARYFFEKAFIFQPGSTDLKNSMSVLLEELGKTTEQVEEDDLAIKRILLFVSPTIIFTLFCILFFVMSLFIFLFIKKASHFRFTLSIGFFVCTFFLFIFSIIQYYAINDNCAIVIQDTEIYLSPDTSTAISSIKEGKKVHKLKSNEDNYIMIQLSNNTNGWLEKSKILPAD